MKKDRSIRKPSSSGRTQAGRELEALVMEILGAFFDLRSAGRHLGLVNESGAGSWGLLRILQTEGPRTVPDVARMRSVSRQYIQKLANELIEEGLIEMIDNPHHRRSRLMRLTGSGERRFAELTEEFRGFLDLLGRDLPVSEVRRAAATLARLRKRLAATGE